MESIIQSQGTLWNIYPQLARQGLQTGDEHFPVMMRVAQDYRGSQRKGEKQRERDINPLHCPRKFFIYSPFY